MSARYSKRFSHVTLSVLMGAKRTAYPMTQVTFLDTNINKQKHASCISLLCVTDAHHAKSTHRIAGQSRLRHQLC